MQKRDEIDTQNRVANQYEQIRYLNEYSAMYQHFWSDSMASLITCHGTILDNGCGIGNFADFLLDDKLIGLDISMGMLQNAKKRMNLLVNADSQNLPMKDSFFDCIICRGLIHHIPNKERALAEMSRITKKGGEIIIAEPIESILSTLPRILVSESDHFSDVHTDFKRSEIIKLVDSQFKIEKIIHFGYIAYPLLGFPDIFNIFKYVPFKKHVAKSLIKMDLIFSHIPLVNRQSWGIIIKAIKQ